MNHNSVYRFGDVIHQVTATKFTHWRSDSMAILCNPQFRGTLLREALTLTAKINDKPIYNLPDNELETLVASLRGGENFSAGHAYGYGKRPINYRQGFQSGLVWAPSKLTVDALCNVVVPRHLRLNSAKLNRSEREMLVPLRLGDQPQLNAFKGAFEEFYAHPWAKHIERATITGVLNYPGDGPHKRFYYSEDSLEKNNNVVATVVEMLERANIATSVSSEPNVDVELLRFVSTPHVLWGAPGRGGLQHLAQELQRRLMGVRFLSCLGTEGSGHHALTPIIVKLFCIGSNISMSRCNSRHVAGPAVSPAFRLAGQTLPELTPMVNDLFEAFRTGPEGNTTGFMDGLQRMPLGSVILQGYSFPTNGRRKTSDNLYELNYLYRCLERAGSDTKALIKYERDLNLKAASVFRRPRLCKGDLNQCKNQQADFQRHIDTFANKFRGPVMTVSMDKLNDNCTQFSLDVFDFLRRARFFDRAGDAGRGCNDNRHADPPECIQRTSCFSDDSATKTWAQTNCRQLCNSCASTPDQDRQAAHAARTVCE